MKIQIGAEVSVTLKNGKTVSANYIGAKDKSHIVLTFSGDNSNYFHKTEEPEKICVEYSDNGVRYEFNTIIIEVLDEPVYLVVLEYPREIKKVNKRSTDRINCLISAKLDTVPEQEISPVLGVIENINKTGCLCILKELEGGEVSLSKGDRVNIACQFPGLVGEQTAGGRIARIKKEKKDIVIGIHFDEKIWWVPPYERK